ncbi:nuclear transport factor 2 family protein [Microbacterium sp. ZW T5_56]|uniref:nuclear transport factor 2 family protein n=1 Tax=Microbacterium sp. ZW T5_56 TaxID=3378081 RepID=UPI0038519BF2
MTTMHLDSWIAAGREHDADLAASALAPNVEMVSPLTDGFVFSGPEEIRDLLSAVFEAIADYRPVSCLRDGRTAVVAGRATVRGVALEEFQHLELDEDGRITRITIAMRPLPAITAFARELGPVLARRQGNPRAARTLRLAGAFLDNIAATGDRRFIPLAAPKH